jgi:hypothetical protein
LRTWVDSTSTAREPSLRLFLEEARQRRIGEREASIEHRRRPFHRVEASAPHQGRIEDAPVGRVIARPSVPERDTRRAAGAELPSEGGELGDDGLVRGPQAQASGARAVPDDLHRGLVDGQLQAPRGRRERLEPEELLQRLPHRRRRLEREAHHTEVGHPGLRAEPHRQAGIIRRSHRRGEGSEHVAVGDSGVVERRSFEARPGRGRQRLRRLGRGRGDEVVEPLKLDERDGGHSAAA